MITLTREEAQQVLDALRAVEDLTTHDDEVYEAIDIIEPLLAQPEPEPVADKYLMEVECTKCGAKQDGVLTVTAPPQREWQGLTDEERSYLAWESNNGPHCVAMTEAKLKEKNA
jgi:hypothetical protein